MNINISTVHQAWNYYHNTLDNPGYQIIGDFRSQAKYAGPEGITHLISFNDEKVEKEYLTKKAYWANPKICSMNPKLLPECDRGNSSGETIKTKLFALMQADLKNPNIKRVTHVTVMDGTSGEYNVFDVNRIVKYSMKFHTICDHYITGRKTAVYYPQRLAEEFKDSNTIDGHIDRDDGQSTLD